MEIKIEPLTEEDANALYFFECENRSFFEKMVPSRGEHYYQFDFFLERHRELLLEQSKGTSYFYLIKDLTGSIVGRINLVDVDQVNDIASIGYRIGESYTGRGIANQAVAILLTLPELEEIKEIRAVTTSHNIASQKILERHHFKQTHVGDDVECNGETVTMLHFVWTRASKGVQG
ncbi:GNAT family N-acetyltransferase [Halalkalibacterium halodurans]|uniref:GNAT family N-acetyltransferase n=1 Tax=Halalkalibacterium halodurans TaxID=86665 RepID=UPI002AA992D0|nr:GNAT family protein [Halalkalibacterium halodurans]MDY7222521.1 GNAT family protein [Halalkalibacterium halodurans]MDY7241742.1 GNAT family protein [Halalkalibacterium halodurans]